MPAIKTTQRIVREVASRGDWTWIMSSLPQRCRNYTGGKGWHIPGRIGNPCGL